MSKEKQCECCHEWWYDSDVKEDLCPNCYDYFKQLKQQLAEKDTRIAELEDKDWYEACIKQLEEQNNRLIDTLKEKDKEIERLKNLFELNNEVVINQGKEIFDLRVQVLQQKQNQTKLTIQELEKVKEEMDLNGNSYCEIRQGTSPHNPTDYAWFNYVKFRNYLNQQIKELKGENK